MDSITFYDTLAGKLGVPEHLVIGKDCTRNHGKQYGKTLRLINSKNRCVMCAKRQDQDKQQKISASAAPKLRESLQTFDRINEDKALKAKHKEVWE